MKLLQALRGCSHRKIIVSLVSLMLILCILILSACKDIPKVDSSSNMDSSDGSNNNSSDITDNSQSEFDPLSGTLSAESVFATELVLEVEPDRPTDCASLNNPIEGLAETEAEALRSTILNAKNTSEIYKITGTTYYISAKGSNDNSGISKDSPFKTIDALDGIKLKSGDAVLFERGSIFRLSRSLNCESGVIYGSYGSGSKPALYFSPKNYGTIESWQPTNKKNVWVTEFPYLDACNVVLGYGSEIGYRRTKGLQELDSNYKFYHNVDTGYLYMYCDLGNPGRIFNSIEIVPQGRLVVISDGFSDIVIDNLCLKYAGNFGIDAGCVNNVSITNCEIGYMGGSQFAGSTNRYGNGIQFWQGGTNITVSNNWVYQTFDSAVTWQGQTKSSGLGPTVYKNIHFDNNLLEYNNADIEFFDTEGSSIENYTMNGNIMRFTCLGWGTRDEDHSIRGIEGSLRGHTDVMDSMKSISIQNNIIDTPARQIISWTNTPEQNKNTLYSNNKVFVNGIYRRESPVIAGIRMNQNDNTKIYANGQIELQNAFDTMCGRGTFITSWIN